MAEFTIFTEQVDTQDETGSERSIEVEAWSDGTIRLDSDHPTHDMDVEAATKLMLALAAAIREAQID